VGALTALINNCCAVVMHLEEIGSGKRDDAATSKGLLKKLKTYFFVIRIHFLLDIFNFIQATVINFSKGKSTTQSNKIPFGQYIECPERNERSSTTF
jgi:hypothetical protein